MASSTRLFLCFGAVLCLVAVASGQNVLLLNGGSANSEGARDAVNDIAVNFGATVTTQTMASLCGSPLDAPISLTYDMLVLSKSDDDFDDCPNQATLQANIEEFANAGNVVLFTGSDSLASPVDTFLRVLLGGTGDGSDGPNPLTVQSNVECDPMTNNIHDIRGVVMSISADFDSLVMAPGAFMCVESAAPSEASWSLRPMANGGIITYITDNQTGRAFTDVPAYADGLENLLSYSITAGGGGDPHMFGFDKSSVDLITDVSSVVNVLTDRDLQVNVETVEFEHVQQMFKSFMGKMAFITASGDTVVVDAVAAGGPAMIVNGEATLCAEFPSQVTGRSFGITRNPNPPASAPIAGLGADLNRVAQAFSVNFDRYSFEVYVVDFYSIGTDTRFTFVDFTVRVHGSGHAPSGILGRTLHAERSGRNTGELVVEDFLVEDGLLGSKFPENRFGA